MNKRYKRLGLTILLMTMPLLPSFSSNAQRQSSEEGSRNTSQSNLAPNPSFEEGEDYPLGWEIQGRGEGRFRWKSAQGRTDTHALSISNLVAGSNLQWVTSRFIAIEPDHDYEISAWYRNTTQTSSVAFLAIFWGENETALGSTGIWQLKPTAEWTHRNFVIRGEQVKKSFPGANRVKLSFGGSTRIEESGAIWIDDVAFADVTSSR